MQYGSVPKCPPDLQYGQAMAPSQPDGVRKRTHSAAARFGACTPPAACTTSPGLRGGQSHAAAKDSSPGHPERQRADSSGCDGCEGAQATGAGADAAAAAAQRPQRPAGTSA